MLVGKSRNVSRKPKRLGQSRKMVWTAQALKGTLGILLSSAQFPIVRPGFQICQFLLELVVNEFFLQIDAGAG